MYEGYRRTAAADACLIPRDKVRLAARTVRWIRLAPALGALAVFALAYLLSAGFRAEVDRAAGMLYRGDVAGLRDYILSFGAWAPVVSALLMVFQALVAPLDRKSVV